jgi:Glycosyl hydrolases family 35
MAPSRRTWFDERGLVVEAAPPAPSDDASRGDGAAPTGAPATGAAPIATRRLDLFLGSLHYWRTPPGNWARCLGALRELGLTAVETPVSWRVHESGDGRFEWKAEKDLRRFLELCRAEGLAAVLHIGPCTGAEQNGLGFPDDVLAAPEMSARTAHGSIAWLPAPPRSLPIPSYGSEKFLERVRRWYRILAEQLQGFVGDPVVALVVDGDAPRRYRGGAYDLDYHPDVLARWATAHPEHAEPPRRWDAGDEARCLAWVSFQREERDRARRALHDALDEAGFDGVARVEERSLGLAHGASAATATLPPPSAATSSSRALLALSSQGPFHPATLRRAALRSFPPSAGASATPSASSSPSGPSSNAGALPFVLEAGVGEAAWMPPTGGPEADRDRALTLLAAGARGLGFAAAVERERWSGGLVDPDGGRSPDAAWAAALLAALREVDWPALRRRAAFAIVTSSAEDDLAAASSLVDPMTPEVSGRIGLGPAGHGELAAAPGAAISHRWLGAVERALERAGLAYDVLGDAATTDELAAYRAVIAPLGERVDRRLWTALREVAEARRAIVVLGPTPPSLDERGQPLGDPPLRRAGKMRPGSLDDLDGLAADLAQLATEPAAWRAEPALTALAHAEDGSPRVLFLHNDARRAVTAALETSDATARALRDAISGERIFLVAGKAELALSASSLRMFLIER